MKTTRSYRTGGAALLLPVLVLCSALLGGCSTYLVTPKAPPPVSGGDALSLSALSLLVVNAEKDTAEHEILTADKGWSGFRGNRQAWSKRLVESLSRELAVRGAQLRSTAPVVLSLAVPEITFSETRDQFQFTVRVVVSSSAGWSKEYEGVAASFGADRGRSTGRPGFGERGRKDAGRCGIPGSPGKQTVTGAAPPFPCCNSRLRP